MSTTTPLVIGMPQKGHGLPTSGDRPRAISAPRCTAVPRFTVPVIGCFQQTLATLNFRHYSHRIRAIHGDFATFDLKEGFGNVGLIIACVASVC